MSFSRLLLCFITTSQHQHQFQWNNIHAHLTVGKRLLCKLVFTVLEHSATEHMQASICTLFSSRFCIAIIQRLMGRFYLYSCIFNTLTHAIITKDPKYNKRMIECILTCFQLQFRGVTVPDR